ncbi:MAG: hypothetical protein K8F92_03875 [Hyphomicrobium sp.]|uniref:hypothetical protein n=1 Tax=Hyphomicrobium sp. TaxID=82 RepID=UPI001328DDE0|nr:hypothetical protein [Hyphomicrobium sp.]KAB2943511.1 MAG: hypothetical protein F9K20_02175 [Hyphomicrobium sp.]MBZ0208778.1 hypothetical protein [Hyphomicrobium sp.]
MRLAKKSRSEPGLSGMLLAAGFIALALGPFLAARLSGLEPVGPFNELGTALGLTAAALILLQFLSAGRYESLSG